MKENDEKMLFLKTDVLFGVQEKYRELLKHLHSICEENHIPYYLFFGSLLGAVRHKGFIPWDDDLDVLIPRTECDRLCAMEDELRQEGLVIQSSQKDPRFFRGGAFRLIDTNTTAFEGKPWEMQCIGIDIIPLDNWDSSKGASWQWRKIKFLQDTIFLKIYGRKWGEGQKIGWLRTFLLRVAYALYGEKSYERLSREQRKKNGKDAQELAILSLHIPDSGPLVLERHTLEPAQKLLFEHIECCVPRDYNYCLGMLYGENFMSLPPCEKRRNKHLGIYDTVKGYQWWREKIFFSVEDIPGKNVIVFGRNKRAQELSQKFPPNYVIDVFSLEEDIEIIIDKYRKYLGKLGTDIWVIICDDEYFMAEEVVKKLPDVKYKFFISDKASLSRYVQSKYKGGISEAEYIRDTHMLIVRGWALPKMQRVDIWVEDNVFPGTCLSHLRKDVWNRYPIYDEKESGWICRCQLDLKKADRIYIEIVYDDNNNKVCFLEQMRIKGV